jgi:hypothetical protein
LLFELHKTYAGDARISTGKSYQHLSRILPEQLNIAVSSEQTTIEVNLAKVKTLTCKHVSYLGQVIIAS